MSADNKTEGSSPQKPLRLMPGVIIVSLQLFFRFVIPDIMPGDTALIAGVFAGILGGWLSPYGGFSSAVLQG